MTLNELIQSIHSLENHLQKFEEKYKIRSEDFYILAKGGKLEQDPDFVEWLGIYEIKLKRQEKYRQMVSGILPSLEEEIELPLAEDISE